MKKIKLLLVDDEENFVRTLAERLQIRDLGSNVALSGEEALAFLDKEPPDVIVLDLRMPGIDGMEVLRRVKRDRPNIQVIILTGHGTDKDKEEATRIGAFEYHKKPVDIDALVFSIKNAYRKRMEDMMVAATFAQAGDFDDAEQLMVDEGLKDKRGK
ncbi:response regulator receiver protein [Desulfovibrio sp. X2]|uniref:response regulator n=1 Tax=Desulfovibrio sp. X2 TaxID=941449 RepID=UPI0003587078|nr:response regulator [Desulfovibrio sp. X2]EPR37448.1 response regulator receiver protein [Desulfovibrio sp. X2]